MRAPILAAALAALAPLPALAAGGPDHDHGHPAPAQAPSAYAGREALDALRETIARAPEGVADLDFRELLAPIGRRGLSYSEKARALDGKTVRLLGYMVGQDLPADGRLLLAPYPFQLHETEYGLAEDLPASTVHVIVPDRAGEKVPFTPGPLLLTGRLELGPREEPDGRISTVRLFLHPAHAARAAAPGPSPQSPQAPTENHR